MRTKIINQAPNYSITDTGAVINNNTGRIMKPIIMKDGYIKYNLMVEPKNQKPFMAHRLVAEAFCEGDQFSADATVNHIDENKQNNLSSNLEWCPAGLNTSKHFNNPYPLYISLNKKNKYVVRIKRGDWKVEKHFDTLVEAVFYKASLAIPPYLTLRNNQWS